MTTKLATENLVQIFQMIGLDDRHALVYQILLEKGALPAGSIAKAANIARSTVYEILEDLAQNTLVTEKDKLTKAIFTPSHPNRLKELLEEKSNKLNASLISTYQNLPILEALYQAAKPTFPKIQFFEGENGLKSALYDSLGAKVIRYTSQGSTSDQSSLHYDPSYLKDYIEQIHKSKIQTKEILQNSNKFKEYKKKFSSDFHKILLAPEDLNITFGQVDKLIYDNKVTYILHDKLTAVTIEDETISTAERYQFEALWDYYLNLIAL